MKWEIQLNGDAHDLKELKKSLTDDNLMICAKERQYFLKSSIFEKLTTYEEVASLAAEVLQILTGAVRLCLGGRTPLHVTNIAKVRPDGGRDIVVTVSETIHLRDTVGIEITKPDGTSEIVNPADKIPDLMKLGLSDVTVAKALRLHGADEHNWGSLYRLYEVIEDDVGGIDNIVNYGWATKTSIKRFKHTANSPGAVGDASRHGKESTAPPPNPMDLCEARAMVEVIMHNWLRSKG